MFRVFAVILTIIFISACSTKISQQDGSQSNPEKEKVVAESNQELYKKGKDLCCGSDEKHDTERAYTYLCMAAKQNYTPAQYELGRLFEKIQRGKKTNDNYMSALMWYNIASENGSERAKEAQERVESKLGFLEKNEAILHKSNWINTSCKLDQS